MKTLRFVDNLFRFDGAEFGGSQAPCVFADNGRWTVFFSARDAAKRSHPFAADIEGSGRDAKLLGIRGPLLRPGEAGTFDDSGVMPSQVIRLGTEIFLYYVGWNRSDPARYRTSIGAAVSRDGGQSFEKLPGPLLDRSPREPVGLSMPFVVPGPGSSLQLYYMSYTKWAVYEGVWEPFYEIRKTMIDHPVDWQPRETQTIFAPTGDEAAYARPVIYDDGTQLLMSFCARGPSAYRTAGPNAYRFAFGRSSDRGQTWFRDDSLFGLIAVHEPGQMMAYPYLFSDQGRPAILFNTNFLSAVQYAYGL